MAVFLILCVDQQGFEYHSGVSQSLLIDVVLKSAPVTDSYGFIPQLSAGINILLQLWGVLIQVQEVMYVCMCVYVPAGFPATAYGPVAAAAVAAARGSGRGARGRGGYLAYPQSTGPGKRSVHVLCGCCSLQLLLLCFSLQTLSPEPTCTHSATI